MSEGMARVLVILGALACAGCVRTVSIQRVSFDRAEKGYIQAVADLDSDLWSLGYFIKFEYSLSTPYSPWSHVQNSSVEYIGPFHGSESLSRCLSERIGAAQSEGAPDRPPYRVRLYLPWNGETGPRLLTLRAQGFKPYSNSTLDSNTASAVIDITPRHDR